jgi:hypothetical protein
VCHEDREVRAVRKMREGPCVSRTRASRCCIGDDGRPIGAALLEEASNRRMRLSSKDVGRERSGQKAGLTRQVWTEEMNVSEPLSYASKTLNRRHQNQGLGVLLGAVRRPPIYRSHDVRCREGMNSVLALIRNLRSCKAMLRENAQARSPR